MFKQILTYSMVGTLVFILTTPLFAQSSITVDNTRFDFGTISEGENALVFFKLQNHSSKPVRSAEVHYFVACVQSVPFEKKWIEPAQSLELHYVFESLGYGGVIVNKEIEVYVEKMKYPLKLSVTGNVLASRKRICAEDPSPFDKIPDDIKNWACTSDCSYRL